MKLLAVIKMGNTMQMGAVKSKLEIHTPFFKSLDFHLSK